MPRIDKLQRQFPGRFPASSRISGPLRGPVDNVDLGMRFRDRYDPARNGALVMKEVMLPICSPAYRDADKARTADRRPTPSSASPIPRAIGGCGISWLFLTQTDRGPAKSLWFSDYAVVVQAALLGQGIALGLLTVASHWLLDRRFGPGFGKRLSTTRRLCELVHPHDRSIRPVVSEIRDWIIEQIESDMAAIDRLYPSLGLMPASY